MVCGTLKTCCAGVAFFVLTVGASAKTCVWSGDAKDGKWSTAENWVDGAVPADGDIVSVSGAYGSDMENDIDNLSVSRIWFLGEDAVRLTGKALSIKATVEKAWTNQCPLECQVPLKFSPMSNSGVWNIYATCEKETHFYQKIESTSGCRLNLYSTFVSGQNNRHVYFHAPVVGAQISVLPCGGHFHFYESLTNSNYISSSSYSDKGSACKACFYKPLKYGYMNLAFKIYCPMAENVLDPDSELRFSGWRDSGVLDLNGFDQTVNFVSGDYLYNGTTPPNSDDDRCIRSSAPATLTMRATSNGNAPAIVTEHVTLKYDPVSSSQVQTFEYRTNTTDGAILVMNGTFRLANNARFLNVPMIYVGATAALEIDADNGVENPFPSLRTIEIEKGGKLRLPADVNLAAAQIVYDGSVVEDGTVFTSQEEWIEGDGSITASKALLGNGATVWTAVSGEWNSTGNWSLGVPSAELPSRIFGLFGRGVTVSVLSDATPSTNLTIASGHADEIKFQVGARLPFVDAYLDFGKGTKVEIGDGGKLHSTVSEYLPNSALSYRMKLYDGASIEVKSGGVLEFVDIPGHVKIGGGTDSSGGTLKVAEGGVASFVQGAKNAVVEVAAGGEIELGGVLSVARRYGNNNSKIFVMEGGSVKASGNGAFVVTGGPDNSKGGSVYFSQGDVEFSDNSMIRYSPEGSWDSSVYFGSTSASGPLNAKFEGNACISNFIGHLYVSGASGKGAFLDMSSVVDGFIVESGGSFYDISVGYKGGDGKFVYGGSGFFATLYGVCVGFATDAVAEKSYGSGEMVLMNGAIVICGASAAASRSTVGSDKPLNRFYGTLIGVWLNAPQKLALVQDVSASRLEKGVFRMRGRTTKYEMQSGHFVVGAGLAEGRYVQEDGTNIVLSSNWSVANGSVMAYTTNNVMAVGMLGGKGECIISNGLFTSKVRTFVGGCHTNEYFDGAYFKYGTENCTAGLRNAADGALRVIGGSFECEKTVFVGVDGEGLVEIGPTGMFSADTLVLSNSTASAVKFTFGGEGTVGTATVKRLVVAEGAKLNVDLSGVSGDDLKKLKYALVHFDEMEGRFAEDDIFVTVADASDARLNRAAIEYRNGGIYLSTPKTGLHLTIR